MNHGHLRDEVLSLRLELREILLERLEFRGRDAKQFGDRGFEGLSADQMKKSPPRFPS
jgi:hypothetical protein